MILRGTVFSKVLGMETGITIVASNDLPAKGDCGVAYVLHGLCGSSGSWADYSMLPYFARHGSTIYVMPDAAKSFYTDMRHGPRYFTYLTEELPQLCKSLFNISAKREDTAVIGGSMGGYGALKAALTRPEQYGFCAAFSSGSLFSKTGLNDLRENGLRPEFAAKYGSELIETFCAIFGAELAWKPEYELLELAKKASIAEKKPVLYLTCGSADLFREDHERFARAIGPLGFDFTYEEWEGGHDFTFFNESLRRTIDRFSL